MSTIPKHFIIKVICHGYSEYYPAEFHITKKIESKIFDLKKQKIKVSKEEKQAMIQKEMKIWTKEKEKFESKTKDLIKIDNFIIVLGLYALYQATNRNSEISKSDVIRILIEQNNDNVLEVTNNIETNFGLHKNIGVEFELIPVF